MLGRHPLIASTPETLYMTEGQFQLDRSFPAGASATAARMQNTRLRHMPFTEEQLARELSSVGLLDARAVFATVLDMFRRRQDKPRVLEKTPVHIRHIDELLSWFPDAQILWIVRDGRACVASLLRVKWASNDPVALGRAWVRNMAFALLAERSAPASVRRVSYEKLVAEPEAVIREVEASVDVPHDAVVLDHGKEVETVSKFETSWKHRVSEPVSAARAEAWRSELDHETRQRLAVVMNPMLERLGYPGETIAPKRTITYFAEQTRARLVCSSAGVAIMSRAYRQRMRWIEAGFLPGR